MVQTPIESETFLFLNWNRFKEFQCSEASIFFVPLKKYICQPSRDFYDIGFRYDSAVQVTLTALYLQIKFNEFEMCSI